MHDVVHLNMIKSCPYMEFETCVHCNDTNKHLFDESKQMVLDTMNDFNIEHDVYLLVFERVEILEYSVCDPNG